VATEIKQGDHKYCSASLVAKQTQSVSLLFLVLLLLVKSHSSEKRLALSYGLSRFGDQRSAFCLKQLVRRMDDWAKKLGRKLEVTEATTGAKKDEMMEAKTKTKTRMVTHHFQQHIVEESSTEDEEENFWLLCSKSQFFLALSSRIVVCA